MRAPLNLFVQRLRIKAAQSFAVLRIDDAYDAGAKTRQRHERERAGLGVKFRRDVSMRARMGDVEGEGGLRIIPPARFDPGGGAAKGLSSVRADGERSRNASAPLQPRDHRGRAGLDRLRLVFDPLQERQRGGAPFEALEQMAVLDIVPERVEAEFGRLKARLGRTHETRGGIHDAQRAKRRGVPGDQRPHAQPFEGGDRPAQQRRSAIIAGRLPRDQGR